MNEHDTLQRLSVRVTGRVHGVGFRHFVKTRARRLGLTGWVRNEPGPAVSLVAEGPKSALESLLTAVEQGPAMAAVQHTEVHWQAATGAFSDFSVRYF